VYTSPSALPELAIVVPCYNEEEALPITAKALCEKIAQLQEKGIISQDSYILFIDDGSRDKTWQTIVNLSLMGQSDNLYKGRIKAVRLSANVGHQNALLSGLHAVSGRCDISVSIDADLQDDVDAIDVMIEEYKKGAQIVLGVRKSRDTDTFFKRFTARAYYTLLSMMKVHATFDHADFRLMSAKVLKNLVKFREQNLFLRAFPRLLHRDISVVEYNRSARVAGETKYPLKKMLALAWAGITSFSIMPLRLVTMMGFIISISSVIAAIFVFRAYLSSDTVPGWASITLPMYLLGGLMMLSIGILGEYIAKIFAEVKSRPRFLFDDVIGMDIPE
jgi:glycosyltransferase involved in cell wall biosynthesis